MIESENQAINTFEAKELVERTNRKKNPIYNIYNISRDQLLILLNQRGSQQALYCSSDLWQLFLKAAQIKGQNGSRALRLCMVDYIFNAAREPMTVCDLEAEPEPVYVTRCLYCQSQATIAARSYNGRYLVCDAHFKEHRTRFQSWEKLP